MKENAACAQVAWRQRWCWHPMSARNWSRWLIDPLAADLARRVRIVQACADDRENTTVARRMRLSRRPFGKCRTRLVADRVAELFDKRRPGTPRHISDVIIRMLETTPRGPRNGALSSQGNHGGVGEYRDRCELQRLGHRSLVGSALVEGE